MMISSLVKPKVKFKVDVQLNGNLEPVSPLYT